MLSLSGRTFRERWPVFIGAIVTVCLGVALVQSSLLLLISSATATIPSGLPAEQAAALNEGYTGATIVLSYVLMLATFVTVFIVASTFAFTVAQRRRELALLRLTGASQGQVRVLLLGEALLLGLVGSGLGLLVGLPVMRVQEWLLGRLAFVPPGFTGQWRSWIVAVSVGTGVTVAVAGVLAASRRASRVRPLEALREAGTVARVMTAGRWVTGLFFLAGGVAMMILVPTVGGIGALAISICTCMVLVIAFAALAPLLVPLVSWILRPVLRGRLGELVHANLRTAVRRSASTAAPVLVLVGIVAGLAGAVQTVSEAARRELHRDLRADLVVLAVQVAPELSTVEGVAAVSAEAPLLLDVVSDGVAEPTEGLAVDPDGYAATHRLDGLTGTLSELDGDTVAVSPDQERAVGDTLVVHLNGQDRDLRVVAVLPGTLSGPALLLPTAFAAPDAPHRYLVQLAPGADPGSVAASLRPYGEVVRTADWIDRTAGEQDDLNTRVLIVLLGLAVAYTVLAMVNTVVISASDRRTEFATARVTGLTRGQVVGLALAESVAVIVVGLVLGGLAAAGTVGGITVAIDDLTGLWVVAVPWSLLGALTLATTVVVGATTVVTTLAATRLRPIHLVAARE